MADIKARMRQLIGTTAQWAANDLVIGDGEVAVEKIAGDHVRIKIGNGVLKYSALPYFEPSASPAAPAALTPAANVAVDFSAGDSFTLSMTQNMQLDNPTHAVAGKSGAFVITQDGTGGHALTFGTAWKFEGGTAPTLTKTANAVDLLTYYVVAPNVIVGRLIADNK